MKINVLTNHPVAYESMDHIEPKGTMNDYTRNPAYVAELFEKFGAGLKYMDLGCAGGGFVEDVINAGGLAVGIEGSDYSLKHKRAAWADDKIPDFLFTADITKPFSVVDENGKQIEFDAISCFDVLEHISKTDLPQVFKNVRNHLKPGGYFITGIATFPDGLHHVTVENDEWWEAQLRFAGFGPSDWLLENFGRGTSLNWVIKKL